MELVLQTNGARIIKCSFWLQKIALPVTLKCENSNTWDLNLAISLFLLIFLTSACSIYRTVLRRWRNVKFRFTLLGILLSHKYFQLLRVGGEKHWLFCSLSKAFTPDAFQVCFSKLVCSTNSAFERCCPCGYTQDSIPANPFPFLYVLHSVFKIDLLCVSLYFSLPMLMSLHLNLLLCPG